MKTLTWDFPSGKWVSKFLLKYIFKLPNHFPQSKSEKNIFLLGFEFCKSVLVVHLLTCKMTLVVPDSHAAVIKNLIYLGYYSSIVKLGYPGNFKPVSFF